MKLVRDRFFPIPFAKILLVLALLIVSAAPSISAEGEAAEMELLDGKPLLQQILDQCKSWTDYSVQAEMHNFKPHATTITHSKIMYKAGPLVRIEMIGGFKHGTVLLRGADGKYAGKGGFWLGGMPLKFDPDSQSLQLPSGYNALRSDFPETFGEMKELTGKGYSCKVSANPVQEPKYKTKALVLELFTPEKQLSERVYLAPDGEHYPLRWDSLKDGQLKCSTWFKNMKVNAGLSDKLFKL